MNDLAFSHLYRRVTKLRWQAPVLAFLLVLAHQLVQHTWLIYLPRWQHFATQILFYGLIGPFLAWWALTSLRHSVVETEKAELALKKTGNTLREVNEQLTCLLHVNHRLTAAEDEEGLLDEIVKLPLEILPALGCSLIPLDVRERPLPALHSGDLESAVMESWVNQLSNSQFRQQCAACSQNSALVAKPCVLYDAATAYLEPSQIYCLSLARNGRTYAKLSIYVPALYKIDEQKQSLLHAMAQEMSLALESQSLQTRELKMLSRLQRVNRMQELRDDLGDVLTHAISALEVDGGMLLIIDEEDKHWQPLVTLGQLPAKQSRLIERAKELGESDSPVVIPDFVVSSGWGKQSLLMAPMKTHNRTLGSLVFWTDRIQAFTQRRTQLVAIVADQAALLIENQHLYLQSEYQIALDERARLAREIHDGLAQTLGYLKLRTSQIAGWLEAENANRIPDALDEVRQLLHEAYADAREAIDGLRLHHAENGLDEWLHEIVFEFEQLSGVAVETAVLPNIHFPLEVQVQLQRIIQESLSNIRKHAQASRVWIEWQVADRARLCIRDNGRGFDPNDILPFSRHGLLIMEERAALLNADFKITALPQQGTEISISLPLPAPEVFHE